MAAFDDFKAFLLAEVEKVNNTFDQYKAKALIDEWAFTYQALSALRGSTVTSYSIAGRSATRQSIPTLQTDLMRLQRDIEDILYLRSVGLVDNRGYYSQTWPFVGGSINA